MIIEQAKKVLRIEAEGLLSLIERVNQSFVDMVELVNQCTGRLVIGGIGKSGLVGQKIVATLNSTGTHALFLHPVEAMHGDLGMLDAHDIFLAISYSGETRELNSLLPIIRDMGCKTIAFTGGLNSSLARLSDIVIDIGIPKEACPMGLAPTTSTTATLAMGDALAVALINKHQFKSSDFKKFHPGGNLGQRLSMKIKDLMMTDEQLPLVNENRDMKAVIQEMNRESLGAVFIVDSNQHLLGIITDGDIRRSVAMHENILDLPIETVMVNNPRTLAPEQPAVIALNLMEKYQITILPIVDKNHKIQGILHLHDILGKGEFAFTAH
ncbi:MAG: arabinose-5-phosphate isomerase [Candidatus Magnetoglobus multicellularis str. Araruama]|uniref:Arabinose-5-phosphate isomerase n=1 Tax=Candidatus Magnetoglobus multicellularis str. Araruama TaxID=890399 RepID=A0A1V1PCD7_9BACT|nr:MAG: arabinose-5-phosphate isomerase [Candidatus Magnetoglobus multicellularis str. Araruama]